ncbi:MAG TPA: flippase-like domain-containing protein [Nitrospirae bacterium]|nr:hypothetical protein BMS3Bbin09_01272 [bacterium BMS3Bbin09]HDO67413.1 flippase-like domain-containing protein [Nitrospirota bacterium]HEW81587.1 flippase-like domain-containing protein [Nitrospirota bacterium]
MKKNHLHLIIGLVIIVLSLYFAFRGVKLSEIVEALLAVNYLYLFPAIILVLSSYLFRAIRWRFLIRSVTDISTKDIIPPMMIGFMGNMLPARAGEFIRAYMLSKKANISFSSSFASIFIERLFDLIIVLLLLCWVLIFIPDAFVAGDTNGAYEIVNKVKYFGILSFSLCVFIFLFSALLQFKNELAMKIVNFFIRPLSAKWKEKITEMVHSFTTGLEIIRDKKGFLSTVFLSFLIWGNYLLTYYTLHLAFGIENDLPILSSLIIVCLTVSIFITVAPTPGFLGSFHLGCVAALNGIFGIPKAIALSYGIIAWLLMMGATVTIGAFFAIKENVSLGEFSEGKK